MSTKTVRLQKYLEHLLLGIYVSIGVFISSPYLFSLATVLWETVET